MCDLETLYQQHEPVLRAFIANRVPNRTDRDDVFQTVSYKITRGFRNFDGRNFRGWSLTIARNAILDYHAQQNHNPTLLTTPNQLTIAANNPLTTLLNNERQQAVRDCVGRLRDLQKEVFRRRMLNERNADIAEALAITAGHASNLFRAAVDQLRHCTDSQGI